MNFLIEIQHLSKRFGEKEVLRDVNANIKKGEIFCIIGPSGSGKSTLLRLINLLDTPSEGRILIDGIDINSSSGQDLLILRRKMSMVFQNPAVFNTSVFENIAYGLRFRKYPEQIIRAKVGNALEEIGMAEHSNQKSSTLSGGEMQRVALARAMVTEPDFLLLDEPTANLDRVATEKIEELILHYNQKYHTTVIMATHDMNQGQRLSDRVAVMMNGRFTQSGSPREIFFSPQNDELARFVGIENIFKGSVIANDEGVLRVKVNGVMFTSFGSHSPGDPVSCYIRGENIVLSKKTDLNLSARNVFTGMVSHVVPFGPVVKVTVDIGIPVIAVILQDSANELEIGVGKPVAVLFKATSVHCVALRKHD